MTQTLNRLLEWMAEKCPHVQDPGRKASALPDVMDVGLQKCLAGMETKIPEVPQKEDQQANEEEEIDVPDVEMGDGEELEDDDDDGEGEWPADEDEAVQEDDIDDE
jgi:hypothetical protein